MNMKFSHIKTHWTADEAHMMISFLADLKDMLWASYGEEIIEMHRSDPEYEHKLDNEGLDEGEVIDFDDSKIDF